jgi:hypothetical protein
VLDPDPGTWAPDAWTLDTDGVGDVDDLGAAA